MVLDASSLILLECSCRFLLHWAFCKEKKKKNRMGSVWVWVWVWACSEKNLRPSSFVFHFIHLARN